MSKEEVDASLTVFWEAVQQIDEAETYGLRAKLQARLDRPPTAILSNVLSNLPPLTDDEARQLLFTPSAAQMAWYPILLEGDSDHPCDMQLAANKAQAAAITHMYLVHAKCWQRLRPFIEAGGLRQLAALVTHPQHIMAAQALDLLLYATHPDMYDWNPSHTSEQQLIYTSSSIGGSKRNADSMPDTEDRQTGRSISCDTNSSCNMSKCSKSDSFTPEGTANAAAAVCASASNLSTAAPCSHPASGPDALLWQQLLQLQSGPLLGILMRLSPDVWPGSGFKALQFLAFYLSWLRMWWSKDGVLQLSADLLQGLSVWSVRAAASAEERQLAGQLLADFSTHGPAPSASCGGTQSDDTVSGPEMVLRVVADRTLVNSSPGSEAERLKAAGNDAFKAKDWCTAIQLYSAALDVPVPHEALLDEGPRRALYHANRAAAYLEQYKELEFATASTTAGDGNGTDQSGSSSCDQHNGFRGSNAVLEVGGVLDGVLIDTTDAEARTQLLQAAVLDCRAALDLAPTHVKAHYRLATALRAQGNLTAAYAAAQSAEQHAKSKLDQAAAAQLAAAIAKQLSMKQQAQTQRQQTQHPVGKQQCQQSCAALQDSTSAAAANSKLQPAVSRDRDSSRCKVASTTVPQSAPEPRLRQHSRGSAEHLTPAAGNAASAGAYSREVDAVDALLQHFAAAVKQQSLGSGSDQPTACKPAQQGSSKQAGVLMPSILHQEQQQTDQQLLGDQLLLPTHASSQAKPGKQQHVSKPLIQELPDLIAGQTQSVGTLQDVDAQACSDHIQANDVADVHFLEVLD